MRINHFCVSILKLARDGKPARDAQDELEEQMLEQPRTRLEQEAHAAEMAVRAREKKE